MCSGRWVPQYDSLFIIQNEILFWQLTMRSVYSTARDGLESLCTRLKQHGKSVQSIVIDNCCMWRKKITDTFGGNVQVKLVMQLNV